MKKRVFCLTVERGIFYIGVCSEGGRAHMGALGAALSSGVIRRVIEAAVGAFILLGGVVGILWGSMHNGVVRFPLSLGVLGLSLAALGDSPFLRGKPLFRDRVIADGGGVLFLLGIVGATLFQPFIYSWHKKIFSFGGWERGVSENGIIFWVLASIWCVIGLGMAGHLIMRARWFRRACQEGAEKGAAWWGWSDGCKREGETWWGWSDVGIFWLVGGGIIGSYLLKESGGDWIFPIKLFWNGVFPFVMLGLLWGAFRKSDVLRGGIYWLTCCLWLVVRSDSVRYVWEVTLGTGCCFFLAAQVMGRLADMRGGAVRAVEGESEAAGGEEERRGGSAGIVMRDGDRDRDRSDGVVEKDVLHALRIASLVIVIGGYMLMEGVFIAFEKRILFAVLPMWWRIQACIFLEVALAWSVLRFCIQRAWSYPDIGIAVFALMGFGLMTTELFLLCVKCSERLWALVYGLWMVGATGAFYYFGDRWRSKWMIRMGVILYAVGAAVVVNKSGLVTYEGFQNSVRLFWETDQNRVFGVRVDGTFLLSGMVLWGVGRIAEMKKWFVWERSSHVVQGMARFLIVVGLFFMAWLGDEVKSCALWKKIPNGWEDGVFVLTLALGVPMLWSLRWDHSLWSVTKVLIYCGILTVVAFFPWMEKNGHVLEGMGGIEVLSIVAAGVVLTILGDAVAFCRAASLVWGLKTIFLWLESFIMTYPMSPYWLGLTRGLMYVVLCGICIGILWEAMQRIRFMKSKENLRTFY